MLLNVHVSERPYFEHLRVTEAILSGAVVLSEPGRGIDPLIPGVDLTCGRRVARPPRFAAGRRRGAPRSDAGGGLGRARRAPAQRGRRAARHGRRGLAARRAWAAARRGGRPAPPPPPPRPPGEDPDVAVAHRALKQLRLEGIDMRRLCRGSRRSWPARAGARSSSSLARRRTPPHARTCRRSWPCWPRAPHRRGARLGRAQHAPRGGGRGGRRRLGGRVVRPRDRVDGRASVGARRARPPPLEPGAPARTQHGARLRPRPAHVRPRRGQRPVPARPDPARGGAGVRAGRELRLRHPSVLRQLGARPTSRATRPGSPSGCAP